MDIKKTISSTSAYLLSRLNESGKTCFSLKEAQQILSGSNAGAVKKLTRDLVNRGLLLRLKPGTYWVIPYEEDPESFFPNWHLIAACLSQGTKYYIGYYSALTLHSLTTQPALTEQIVTAKQLKPARVKIKHASFQFIYHNPKHFFGSKKIWIDSYSQVNCSDLEKTIIDCLYKPEYGGGIVEILKAMHKSKEKIDYPKMLEYCKQFGSQPVIKRLGFLLELLNVTDKIVDDLSLLKSKAVVPLEPSYENSGQIIRKWSLLQNIDNNALTSPIFS